MRNSTYDIKFKIDSVKDFLRRKSEDPNFGYGRYSEMIHVKKTTFISWVDKYKKDELNYDESKNLPFSSTINVNGSNNDFINLGEDAFEVVNIAEDIDNTIFPPTINLNSNQCKNMSLKINGGVIDFDPSYLKKVIEVLKSC